MSDLKKFVVKTGILCAFGIAVSVMGASYALHKALVSEASSRGMDWAHYIEKHLKDVGNHGHAHSVHPDMDAETEKRLREVAEGVFRLGHIFQIDFFPTHCDCGTSLVPADFGLSVNHDEHDHGSKAAGDDANSGHATMPAGVLPSTGHVHSHDRAPETENASHPVYRYPVDRAHLDHIALQNAHEIYIRNAVASGLPATFAEVLHPVQTNGETTYIIRVLVDLDRNVAKNWALLGGGIAISFMVLMLAVGYPASQYVKGLRRQQEIDKKASYLAKFDVLTGLPNRLSFSESLEDALWNCRQKGHSALLYVFDLNGFKDVNDYYGHDTGDQVLCEFARLLTRCLPESAFAARLGGDEFVLVVGGPASGTPADGPGFEPPLSVSIKVPNFEQVVCVGVSGGVACYPDDADTATQLMQCADLALYSSKAARGGDICIYTPNLKEDFQHRLKVVDEFRAALDASRIEPFYQPILNLHTGEVVGFEALARWRHPDRGVLTPWYFEAALRDPEICQHLGRQMLDKVCRDLVRWKGEGVTCKKVAINVASGDLMQENFAGDVISFLRSRDLEPSGLTFEVTENCLFGRDKDHFIRQLHILRDAGCGVALDDFGTGYSSVTQLKEVPVSIVKIDKSFVDNILDSHEDQSIVTALLGMSRSMGFDVVLEGVETEAQSAFLGQMGAELAQGYLFAKPMPAASVPDWLAEFAATGVFGGAVGHMREAPGSRRQTG